MTAGLIAMREILEHPLEDGDWMHYQFAHRFLLDDPLPFEMCKRMLAETVAEGVAGHHGLAIDVVLPQVRTFVFTAEYLKGVLQRHSMLWASPLFEAPGPVENVLVITACWQQPPRRRSGYTRHGHPIVGLPQDPRRQPPVARCGGPSLCAGCTQDAAAAARRIAAIAEFAAQAETLVGTATSVNRADFTRAQPLLPAGIWRHYKGPRYLLLGVGHDANAEDLHVRDTEGWLGTRTVVVYVALETDGAKEGPPMAVRTLIDWSRIVCAQPRHKQHYGKDPVGEDCIAVSRFTYVGTDR